MPPQVGYQHGAAGRLQGLRKRIEVFARAAKVVHEDDGCLRLVLPRGGKILDDQIDAVARWKREFLRLWQPLLLRSWTGRGLGTNGGKRRRDRHDEGRDHDQGRTPPAQAVAR